MILLQLMKAYVKLITYNKTVKSIGPYLQLAVLILFTKKGFSHDLAQINLCSKYSIKEFVQLIKTIQNFEIKDLKDS